MHIEEIALKRFLLFEDAAVSFGPSLNVVLSPNEGGKSSLMKAIIAALYRDAGSKSREVKALGRWGSDTPPLVSMRIVLPDGTVTVVRDFAGRKQYLMHGNGGDPFARGREVDEFLRSRLPFPDEHLFLRVSGVRHEQLAVADGSPALGERLEEILGGGWGEATPDGIVKLVKGARDELRRGIDHPAKEENWGRLKRVTEEIERLVVRLGETRARADRREQLLRSISMDEGERAGLGEELSHLKERQERAARYNELVRRETDLKGRAEGIRKKRERLENLLAEREKIRLLGGSIPSGLTSAGPSRFEELRRDIVLEETIGAERKQAVSSTGGGEPWKAFLSLALLAGGVLGTIFGGRVFIALIAAGAASLVWYALGRRTRRGGGAVEDKETELERLASERRSWSGGRSLDDARRLLGEAEEWRRAMDAVAIRLEEVSGTAGGGEDYRKIERGLDDSYGEAAAAWQAVRQEVEAHAPFALEADELLRCERAISDTERRLAKIGNDLAPRERELAALPAAPPAAIEERLAELEVERSALERRVRICDVIIDTVGDARRSVAGFLSENLPSRAAGFLSHITGGRYGSLLIDPASLNIETVPADGDCAPGADPAAMPESVGLESLSQGARDQVYLAVRLALVELLGSHDPHPVFLDDPLVHFDPVRRRQAIEIIESMAERHQVLFFTCDPAYGKMRGRLIRLQESMGEGSGD